VAICFRRVATQVAKPACACVQGISNQLRQIHFSDDDMQEASTVSSNMMQDAEHA
jgi:hypothetical protein